MSKKALPAPTETEVALLGRDMFHRMGGDILASPSGDVTTIAGKQNLREAIYRRILAVPGDLQWDPDYGIGIRAEINELLTDSRKKRWITRIRTQLPTDSRIREVTKVTVVEGAEGEPRATITIFYTDVTGGKNVNVFPVGTGT